ncbi:MAG: phosphatidylinositol kinase [Ignavibacteria bacterium RIFOXYB2_FULL_35_12]|nr:MAG: phosphatidylinositol kinase [Ignavibacteria bacterium GWA2_36_19]OGU50912.1 MAG: phosphatidylinositol kinase [Ignavibacteria bacterium GWC2_35_8]OGU57390.1 MAG: phosphatidylinositol kinase [Ignavibacteria bacterium GWF2_35_20]OGU81278.1 MAG: phosphatidylinositol kinase [Ignavibacteria bacterium RIFOXYA2_FULL_35_9]OGU88327.1 MAG: phosphatidylinositol kinase [Ignavibacteria bacterium RIFOXYC12_FULL_35_11]OGU91604.1 MAG: phosphatidylinositol kinase [Ignavibacteria bacterium RIFOXYA12_FULL
MNICPITYQPCGDARYSNKGLKLLSRNLVHLNDLALTQEEQLREAAVRAAKMSIQGVQPKLSARLNVKDGIFDIVDRNGEYILKPQNNFYPELPENESLTMKLADMIDIEVPLSGMIYSSDRKLTYFIKRFDRYGKSKKLSIEDFAQLAGKSRETKYDYTMEKIINLIDTFCTFPAIEKVKLFRLTIFNFLIGNEDMHLKNFSIITRDNKIELSPAYDLLNTTIVLPNEPGEIALPLAGKKRNLNSKILIHYFGKERLNLNDKIISQVLDKIKSAFDDWEELIKISFLSPPMKEKYLDLLNTRKEIIGL